MNEDSILQTAYDEVLKKIGRNLLLFQQAEQMMKQLLTWSRFTSTSDEPNAFEELAKFWQKQTMGQLKNQFVERVCTHTDDSCAAASPHPEKVSITISFTFEGPDGYAEERRSGIDMLVTERNALVHTLILRLDRSSLASCHKVAADLDAQLEKAIPEIKHLVAVYKNIEKAIRDLLSFQATEGMAMLRAERIQDSPLIRNLAAIAGENPDPEAWTPLGPAIKQLQDFPREKIDSLVTQFGLKSLSQLLETSQRFDIQHEDLKHGKQRTLYRLKTATPSATYTFAHDPSPSWL